MKTRDLIRELEADGWYREKRKRGSHRQYKHPTKPDKVTISYESGDELPAWYVDRIRKQAGLK